MSDIYVTGLEANAANYAPLTPLTFLDWSADVYPDRPAVVHGGRRFTWAQTRERCRRLASALSARGVGRGDTVSVVAANTPEMVEAHFGIPMTGAVLNTINTRLDAATIAFILDHAQAKVLITDREFSPAVGAALRQCEARPLVIDIDDPEYAGPGDRLGEAEYEDLLAGAAPEYERVEPTDEWQAISLNYTSGTTGNPKGVVYHHRGAHLNAVGNILTWGMRPAQRLPVDAADVPLQRLVLSVDGRGLLGHERVPAQGRRRRDLPADAFGGRNALLRGAGGAQHADRRPRGVARGCRPGLGHGGRGRAAGRDDRGDGPARVRADPCLRADRDLRARRGVRQARGMGRPGRRAAGAAQRPAGRALPAAGRDDRHRPEDQPPGRPPMARPLARSSSGATSP